MFNFDPISDYNERRAALQWGVVSKDTPTARAAVLNKEKQSKIQMLVLAAVKRALVSPYREVSIPGSIEVVEREGRKLVVQNCARVLIYPSILQDKVCVDAITGASINIDDFRARRAIMVGELAFQMDGLLVHMLKQKPDAAHLKHPVQDRFLTEMERIQLFAELSSGCYVEDPVSLEKVFFDIQGLELLKNISVHRDEVMFLIRASSYFSLMKLKAIDRVIPLLWAEFERLLNEPEVLEVLDRPQLSKVCKEMITLLGKKQVCRLSRGIERNPIKDYLSGKSFIFWGTGRYLGLNSSILTYDLAAADKRLDVLRDAKVVDIIEAEAEKRTAALLEGGIVRGLSNVFEFIHDEKKQCTFYLERVTSLRRRCCPALILNQETEDDYIDPFSLESIPKGLRNAPHVIGVGQYLFTLTSCLRRVLSQKFDSKGVLTHPVESRPLTLEEQYNFLENLRRKLHIKSYPHLQGVLGPPVEKNVLELARAARMVNPSITPTDADALFAIKGSALLYLMQISEVTPDQMILIAELREQVNIKIRQFPIILFWYEKILAWLQEQGVK